MKFFFVEYQCSNNKLVTIAKDFAWSYPVLRTHGVQVDGRTTDGQAPTNISRTDRYPSFLSYGDLLMELR